MLSEGLIFVALLWLLSATVTHANTTAIWQLKEYRLDRIRDHLRSRAGKRLLTFSIAELLLGFSLFVMLPLTASTLALLMVYAIAWRIAFFKLQRPTLTKKALGILLVLFIAELLIILLSPTLTALAIIVGVRFFAGSIIIQILKVPNDIRRRATLRKATRKMAGYNNLLVVGITGSYGKTTTKEFLTQILQSEKRVIQTPEHVNSEIGVANFVLKTDFSDYEVFVVEMGAYKKGEIESICAIVKPSVGILTTIRNQHLSLFGSQEKLQEAKYELIHALPEDGLAITNADNPLCTEFLNTLKSNALTFGAGVSMDPDLRVADIEGSLHGITFKATYKGDTWHVKSQVLGKHNAFNIAPCILAAKHIGLQDASIKKGIESLELKNNYYNIYQHGTATFIDDTYNSNPDGFISALSMFDYAPEGTKKIVITRGMIELGPEAASEHRRVGVKIAEYADELVLISPDNKKDYIEGIKSTPNKLYISEKYGPQALSAYLNNLKEQNVFVLMENRMFSGSVDQVRN